MDFAGQRNSPGTVALTAAGKKKLRGRVGAFLQRRRLAVKAARSQPVWPASQAASQPTQPTRTSLLVKPGFGASGMPAAWPEVQPTSQSAQPSNPTSQHQSSNGAWVSCLRCARSLAKATNQPASRPPGHQAQPSPSNHRVIKFWRVQRQKRQPVNVQSGITDVVRSGDAFRSRAIHMKSRPCEYNVSFVWRE